MSQRKISLAVGEYFHVYNRGNSKQIIFNNNSDYSRFKIQMYLANGSNPLNLRTLNGEDPYTFERGDSLVNIGAYCLMPNHFHILVTPAREGGVQTFMQKLTTGYSMYFNKKYKRTGGLFEGRFKSQHADSDEYLKYLFAYIHLNPVKLMDSEWREKKLTDVHPYIDFLKKYAHSSYLDYHMKRDEGSILSREVFPGYFVDGSAHDAELFSWLSYDPKLQAARTI